MSVLLPEEIFADALSNRYFYLYSKFGDNYASDASFEEWAADPPAATVSEPGTLALLSFGIASLLLAMRQRKIAFTA